MYNLNNDFNFYLVFKVPNRSESQERRKESRSKSNAARRLRDGRSPRFFAVFKDKSAVDPRTPRKRKTRHSNNPPVEHHVGWVMDAREHPPRTHSTGYEHFQLLIDLSNFH